MAKYKIEFDMPAPLQEKFDEFLKMINSTDEEKMLKAMFIQNMFYFYEEVKELHNMLEVTFEFIQRIKKRAIAQTIYYGFLDKELYKEKKDILELLEKIENIE